MPRAAPRRCDGLTAGWCAYRVPISTTTHAAAPPPPTRLITPQARLRAERSAIEVATHRPSSRARASPFAMVLATPHPPGTRHTRLRAASGANYSSNGSLQLRSRPPRIWDPRAACRRIQWRSRLGRLSRLGCALLRRCTSPTRATRYCSELARGVLSSDVRCVCVRVCARTRDPPWHLFVLARRCSG